MILARCVEDAAALFFSTSRVRVPLVFKAYKSTSAVPQLSSVRGRRAYNAWSDGEVDTLIKARKSDMGSKEIHSLYFPYRTLKKRGNKSDSRLSIRTSRLVGRRCFDADSKPETRRFLRGDPGKTLSRPDFAGVQKEI